MLRFRLAGVIHGKTKEPELLTGLLHERTDSRFAAHDLLLNLLDRKIVDVGVRVRMVSEIVAFTRPLLEYFGAGLAKRLNPCLDYETCTGT